MIYTCTQSIIIYIYIYTHATNIIWYMYTVYISCFRLTATRAVFKLPVPKFHRPGCKTSWLLMVSWLSASTWPGGWYLVWLVRRDSYYGWADHVRTLDDFVIPQVNLSGSLAIHRELNSWPLCSIGANPPSGLILKHLAHVNLEKNTSWTYGLVGTRMYAYALRDPCTCCCVVAPRRGKRYHMLEKLIYIYIRRPLAYKMGPQMKSQNKANQHIVRTPHILYHPVTCPASSGLAPNPSVFGTSGWGHATAGQNCLKQIDLRVSQWSAWSMLVGWLDK